MTSGIYCIRNIINNKRYVGQTSSLSRRKATHFSYLQQNKSKNKHLQASYNKYGKENFIFEILEILNSTGNINTDKYLLSLSESDWISVYYPNIYNTRIVSESNLGIKDVTRHLHTEETKKILSRIKAGYKKSNEAKEKDRLASTGRLHSNNAKQKMSIPVIQIDIITQEIICEYWGIRNASETTGIDNSAIAKACKGKLKTAGGYIWKYKE